MWHLFFLQLYVEFLTLRFSIQLTKCLVWSSQGLDKQKEITLSIFACHKVKSQYLLLWQCFLTPINKEFLKKDLIFILYIVIGI
jgi:hypothetical protein